MRGVRPAVRSTFILSFDIFLFKDVEVHHLETPTPLAFSGVRVISEGPLRAAVQTQVKYGKSTIGVTVRILHFTSPFIPVIDVL